MWPPGKEPFLWGTAFLYTKYIKGITLTYGDSVKLTLNNIFLTLKMLVKAVLMPILQYYAFVGVSLVLLGQTVGYVAFVVQHVQQQYDAVD